MYRYPLFILVLLAHLPAGILRAQDWESVEIKATEITEEVYMLQGMGGNIGLVIGEEHSILIDGQFAELNEKILSAIRSLTDKPLQFLLNTHWHRDHTNGNALYHAAGATIIAHEKVKARLTAGGTVPFFGTVIPPQPAEALPKLTFTAGFEMVFGPETIHVIHAPAAHTDGDAFVYLEENNVLHMADVYFAEMYPFIDVGSGGSIKGTISACEKALSMADAQTMVIPGHGPLTDVEALRDYTDMLIDIATKVEALKLEGEGLKAVVDKADVITGPYNERFGSGFISAKDLLTFVFNSL